MDRLEHMQRLQVLAAAWGVEPDDAPTPREVLDAALADPVPQIGGGNVVEMAAFVARANQALS